MIGIGLGVAQIRGNGAADAPDYVEPVGDTPVDPPVGDPVPPTDTPTDPVTDAPEPGIDPDFILADRIDIADSGQTAIRTTNDPGTFGVAYVATPVTGNEYWEYDIQSSTPRNATFAVGITTLAMPLNGIPGERATEIAWWSDGTVRQNDATLIDLGSAGQLGRNDLAGIAINGSGEVFLYKNCAALNSGATVGTLAPAGAIYPFVGLFSARTRINMNFSTARFDCTVPDGFYPIGQVVAPAVVPLLSGAGAWRVPDEYSAIEEMVVIAGGGAGGSDYMSGGGGAGGLIYDTGVTVTPGASLSYSVGDGGLSIPGTATRGGNGANTTFGANTAIGGGAGGAYNNSLGVSPGANGGSGGGGALNPGAVARVGGTGTAGQGFAGGAAYRDANEFLGGAGGGADGAAANSADNFLAPGGAGRQFPTFSAFGDGGWFASGGNAGSGIGGPPIPAAVPGGGGYDGSPNGLANTGGGGVGATTVGGTNSQGGNGGSGAILLAFPAAPAPFVIRTATYSGTGSELTKAHTFLATTQHVAITLCQYGTVSSSLVPAMTINGVSANRRAGSRYSSAFSESAYIFDLASPANGNIVLSDVIGSQRYTMTVYEFGQAMTFDAGTGVDSAASEANSPIPSASVTLSGAGVAIFANTYGSGSGKPLITASTAEDYQNFPRVVPAVDYYRTVSGMSVYDTGGAKSVTYTRDVPSGSIFNFAAAAAFVAA